MVCRKRSKYFPQFVVCRKRSIDEADERSSDVGFDVFVIRRVEPYNISSSHAFLPTTSRREIILFKYAKVYRVNKILVDRLVGFHQRS